MDSLRRKFAPVTFAIPCMKITRILAYRVELPLRETTYKWSGG